MELKKFELFSLYYSKELNEIESHTRKECGNSNIGENFVILKSIGNIGYIVSFVLHSHSIDRGFVYRCIYTGFK